MSHKIIYTCDFCGKEISPYERYMFTAPHTRDGEGGRDEDVCKECALLVEDVIGGLKRKIKEGSNDRG